MLNLIAQSDASFWMPPRASTFANGVDWLFYGIYWLSVAMFLLITILSLVFAWKYRARAGHGPQKSPSHSTTLELTWTVIPIIAVVVIFYAGFRSFMDIATPPQNPYTIHVSARKWSWSFMYPNGVSSPVLVVPKDRPIELVLQSEDYIHSLFVPAFRVKKDVVPGRFNKMWFQATELGEFDLFCAEYCGTNHATMITTVRVIDPSNFTAWLADSLKIDKTKPPAEIGLGIIQARKCIDCHSVDGSNLQAPTFKDLWGRQSPLVGGGTVLVDENYVARSILQPGAEIVAGFSNIMPTYQGQLRPDEITAIIEYLKSISKDGRPAQTWDELEGGDDEDATDGEGATDEAPNDDTATEGAQS